MRVTLIHNPGAGADEPSAGSLLALIRSAGHDAAYQSSKDDGWSAALEDPGDLVAVAGGDGTVGKVARRLIGRRVPIAILPLGTANNVSKTLGLTETPIAQLIAGWGTAHRLKFDISVASGPWGSTCLIEGLGVGLFATTMSMLDARANSDLAHSNDPEAELTSVVEILGERLHSCPAQKLNVTLDGQDLSGEYILLEAMNIPRTSATISVTVNRHALEFLVPPISSW